MSEIDNPFSSPEDLPIPRASYREALSVIDARTNGLRAALRGPSRGMSNVVREPNRSFPWGESVTMAVPEEGLRVCFAPSGSAIFSFTQGTAETRVFRGRWISGTCLDYPAWTTGGVTIFKGEFAERLLGAGLLVSDQTNRRKIIPHQEVLGVLDALGRSLGRVVIGL